MRVLVIEHDKKLYQNILDLFSNVQKNVEYILVNHQNTDGALTTFDIETFDIIILSIITHDKSVIDDLQKLNEKFPAVPVIIITNSDKEDSAIHCMYYGATDYLLIENLSFYILKKSIDYSIENKRLENEIISKQELLKAIGDMAKVGGWEFDVDSNKVTWSEEVFKIHGVDPDYDPNVEKAINFYTPEHLQIIKQAVQRAIDFCEPYDLELSLITAKNKKIWVHTIGQVLQVNGKTKKIYGTFKDITLRKTAEIERNRMIERFNLATHAANFGVWDWDIINNVLVWDDMMYELYNLKREDFSNDYEAWIKGIHPDDREKSNNISKESLESGKDYETEFRVLLPDNSIKYLKAYAKIIRDDSGNPVRMTGINFDITDQKNAISEREIMLELMQLININKDLHELMKAVTNLIKKWSGCSSIGIRLIDNEDYPYFETIGFSDKFVQLETKLCKRDNNNQLVRDSDGNPVLECMCGNVLRGKFDPKKSFFTKRGSFWSNWTTELLATTTEEDRQASTRNRCNGYGYESVAVIALRAGNETFGLLQLNDMFRNRFTEEKIVFYERLADNLALGLAQRKADQTVIESEERYRFLFDESAVAIWEEDYSEAKKYVNSKLNEDFKYLRAYLDKNPNDLLNIFSFVKIINVNKTSLNFFSASSKEDLIRNLPNYFTNQTWMIIKEILIDIFEGKASNEYEMPLNINGCNKEIVIKYSISSDYINSLSKVLFSFIDITDRKFAEESLKKAENNYRSLFDNAILGLYRTTPDGRILMANNSILRMLGYDSFEELSKRNLENEYYIQGNSREEFKKRLVEEGVISGLESTWLKNDGSKVHIRENAKCIKDAYGLVQFYEGTIEDITEKKTTEENLYKSEERFRQVAETAKEWIWEVDKDGLYTYSSPVVEEILGYKPEEVVGKLHFYDLFEPTSREELKNGALQAFAMKESLKDFTNNNISKDGRIVILETTGAPILDENGDLSGYRGTDKDITESKKIEAALKESEEKFKMMAESTSAGIFIYQGTKFIYANPVCYQITGLNDKDLNNIDFWEIVHPDFRETVLKRGLQRQAGDDHPNRYEFKILRKDGKERWVDYTAGIITFGNETAVIGTIYDITERKLAEQEIILNEIKYRQLTEQIPLPLYETDLEGNLKYINKAGFETFGFTCDDLENGINIFSIVVEDTNTLKQRILDIIGGSTTAPKELIVRRKNGNVFPSIAFTNVIIKDGNPSGLRGFIFDITERKEAEAALKSSEERFQLIASTIEEAVWMEDIDINEIVYISQGFEKIWGISIETLKTNPTSFLDAVHLDDLSYVMSNLQLQKQGLPFEHEYRIVRPDGTVRWIWDRGFPIKYGELPVRYYVGVAQDISERKKYEIEILEAKEKAEEISKLKSSFLSNMSHELRTPMNGIMGFSQLLTKSEDLADVLEIGDLIYSSSKRLMDTLNLILDISRIEAGEVRLEPSDFDIIDEVRSYVRLYKPLSDKKNINVVINSDREKFMVYYDKKLISGIISNLVNNAIKFTIEGSVTIDIYEEMAGKNDWLIFKVADTGIGIAEENLKIIFEEFRQASEGLSRSFEGTGLGLTLTKKYIHILGGSINVSSKLNEGSTFTVKLPYLPIYEGKDDIVIFEPEINLNYEDIESQKIKVLLVEDDFATIKLINILFRGKFELDTAMNAIEAINKAQQKQYTVILMDINLGKSKNGMYTTREIRKLPNYVDIPIIAMTAYAMKQDREEFLAGGCTHYISKPFDNEELIELVKDAAGIILEKE